MAEEIQKLSASLEDYLKQIYLLQQTSADVRVTDIATALNISKPSVNRAIKTLKEAGYLDHEHYGTISLTESGQAIAQNIVDSYKVLYKFLTDTLGVDAQTADLEAHQMEHVISKGTRKKIKKLAKKKK